MNMADTIEGHRRHHLLPEFAANALTSAILNTGTVVTYLETTDGNGDSLFFNASTVLTESYYVGDIFVESFPPAASNSAGYNWPGYNYRFIIIPGDIALRCSRHDPATNKEYQLSEFQQTREGRSHEVCRRQAQPIVSSPGVCAPGLLIKNSLF